MTQAVDEVVALERGFWTNADDRHYFEENLADGSITVIEPVGFIDKVGALRMISDRPWTRVEMTDLTIREVTPDCVILAYHGSGLREGDDRPYRGSVASTYIRRDGRWRLALTAHQPWKPQTDQGPTGE